MEARTLIAALEPHDQAALGLAVFAGLRRGELLALHWEDVDLDAGVLHVRRAWDAGGLQVVAPKSKAGTRTVPITERLALLLADHRVLINQSDGLLFPGRHPTGRSRRARSTGAWRSAGRRPG